MISEHLERQIESASEALISRGGQYRDLPILVPASLVLELAGEGLRPRLFFATAPDGSELCLRPDLTIPAVLHYVDVSEHDNQVLAIASKGQVFRGPRPKEDNPPEFLQIGLERFGDPEIIETDVALFLAAWSACQAADTRPLKTRFGDGGLLKQVIAGADLPDIWRDALTEQTSHPRAFLRLLAQASGITGRPEISTLERDLIDLPIETARERVQEALDQDDLALVAQRGLGDVTDRLIRRAQRALAPRLPRSLFENLTGLATFQQTSTLELCLDYVVTLARGLGVDLATWRDDWLTRFEAMETEAPGILAQARFDGLGEEAFDYYDGMVFDIATTDDFSRPVATGGRYDLLVGEVSRGRRNTRAIGCVIRPDRFAPRLRGA